MQLTYLSGESGVLKLFIKMNISANTLFHFVSQRKFLKDILHGKLIPRYCVEHFEINDYLKGDVVIPMKCFCDIPLSQDSKESAISKIFSVEHIHLDL